LHHFTHRMAFSRPFKITLSSHNHSQKDNSLQGVECSSGRSFGALFTRSVGAAPGLLLTCSPLLSLDFTHSGLKESSNLSRRPIGVVDCTFHFIMSLTMGLEHVRDMHRLKASYQFHSTSYFSLFRSFLRPSYLGGHQISATYQMRAKQRL